MRKRVVAIKLIKQIYPNDFSINVHYRVKANKQLNI